DERPLCGRRRELPPNDRERVQGSGRGKEGHGGAGGPGPQRLAHEEDAPLALMDNRRRSIGAHAGLLILSSSRRCSVAPSGEKRGQREGSKETRRRRPLRSPPPSCQTIRAPAG